MEDNFLLTITASVCLRQEAFNVLTDYVLDVTVPFVTTLIVHSGDTECGWKERHLRTSYYILYINLYGDRGSTVVKVLCYKSEGRWFDPSWCHWIFH